MKNNRFINALLRQPVDKTPIWLMRQAGRYLPEYRKLREQAGDFLTMCKNPELACEVTLQPLRRFELDAAIIFSDILTIPDAMGLGLHFVTGEGPQFSKPIRTEKDIHNLMIPDVEEKLSYVTDAIKLVKYELADSVPLIGFAGSPWTLACYMIEGGPSKNYQIIKKMLYDAPELLHALLEKITQATIAYLNAQIDAGADTIMVFDTWGGILSTPAYQEFSLAYMTKIIAAIKHERAGVSIPNIIFTKNGGNWLETMLEANSNAIGLDWTIDIGTARKRIGDKVALQGNLDPNIMLSNPKQIRQQAELILQDFGAHPGHIFNLGHGITPEVPPEHVEILVNHVHEYSAQFHTTAQSQA